MSSLLYRPFQKQTPTNRTSHLRVFDKKLAKMGRGELMAEGSDWDESRAGSREESRVQSRAESPDGVAH